MACLPRKKKVLEYLPTFSVVPVSFALLRTKQPHTLHFDLDLCDFIPTWAILPISSVPRLQPLRAFIPSRALASPYYGGSHSPF